MTRCCCRPTGAWGRAASWCLASDGEERLSDGPALGARLAAAAAVLDKAGASSVALEVPGAGRLADAERARALKAGFLPGFHGRHLAVLGDKALAHLLGA